MDVSNKELHAKADKIIILKQEADNLILNIAKLDKMSSRDITSVQAHTASESTYIYLNIINQNLSARIRLSLQKMFEYRLKEIEDELDRYLNPSYLKYDMY